MNLAGLECFKGCSEGLGALEGFRRIQRGLDGLEGLEGFRGL